jgi:CubicO group peptidase (beta-lactamase class C family)
MTKKKLISYMLIIISSLQVAVAKDFPVDSVVNQKIQDYVEKHKGSPGVVVGIIDSQGERIFTYGLSGNPVNLELSADTRFEIGSISKTLTGTLFADLIISGRVTPEQKLQSLFPNNQVLSNGLEQISLEQLATHTSGLPRVPLDIGSLYKMISTDPYQGSTSKSVLSAASSLPEMLVSDNKSMNYSNLGAALLAPLSTLVLMVRKPLLLRQSYVIIWQLTMLMLWICR